MFALEHKSELSGRWGWMLASGIVDLFLAAMILTGLPGSAAWALGLLVGINMVFGGSALIAMALHARDIDARSTAPYKPEPAVVAVGRRDFNAVSNFASASEEL